MYQKTNEELIRRLYKTRLSREKFEGIPVCDEWKGEHGFKNFKSWCLENGWKQGLYIDRKNTLLGYSPENCRFVTLNENNRNKTNTVFVRYNGEIRKLVELAEEYGIKYTALYCRLRLGWDLDRALTTPVKEVPRRKRTGAKADTSKKGEPLPIAIPYKEAIEEVINTY